jgi:2-polyprenyl-3-methyl-5-hydroxy-6-metoxy-1,4-benzoquinol methylase
VPYPDGFTPDLRRLQAWPSLIDSLWRNPDLVRLTYSALARLVQTHIGTQPCKILYVGPGLGHIALELARGGHDVTGVDIDPEAVSLARRTAESDPFRERRGSLSYEVAEFPGGVTGEGSYDAVLFSRVLHHIPDPTAAVDKAAGLLTPTGRIACVDFAYDRLGDAEARWIAHTRMRLWESGWWPRTLAHSVEEEADRATRGWRDDHEDEGLNPFQSMLDPLLSRFDLETLLWHPYLFWELATDMRMSADREGAAGLRMREEEADLLRQRRIQGVLFSTTGGLREAARG